jgi:hypothetical protein
MVRRVEDPPLSSFQDMTSAEIILWLRRHTSGAWLGAVTSTGASELAAQVVDVWQQAAALLDDAARYPAAYMREELGKYYRWLAELRGYAVRMGAWTLGDAILVLVTRIGQAIAVFAQHAGHAVGGGLRAAYEGFWGTAPPDPGLGIAAAAVFAAMGLYLLTTPGGQSLLFGAGSVYRGGGQALAQGGGAALTGAGGLMAGGGQAFVGLARLMAKV